MPQPILSIAYFSGTVTGVSGAFASSEITGECFWSITASASTPSRPDIASGAGSLINGSFSRNTSPEQQISGIFSLSPVTVDTPLYFHIYQSHDDGDSLAITEPFIQDYSVTANNLIVTTDSLGLNLSVNFDYDIGLGSNSAAFYFVIDEPDKIDNAWADAVRLGLNEGYGTAIYASGDLAPGAGTSFSVSAHDLAGIQSALTEGVTYGIGIAASDARSIQNFTQPTTPVLTTTFVASFASAVTAAVDSVNNSNPVLDGLTSVPFTYSGFSGEVTSARLLDSFGGAHTLVNFISAAGVGVFDAQDVVSIVNSASTAGVAFTAANNVLTFELTDGTDTATIEIIYNPSTGYAVTEHIASVNTGLGSWFEGFTGSVAEFDQTFYPTPGNTQVADDGIIQTDLVSGSIIAGASYDQTVNQWLLHSVQVVDDSISGSLGLTLDLNTVSVSARQVLVGAVSVTLQRTVVTISATNTARITSSASIVLDEVTLSVTGQVTTPLNISGEISQQLQSNVASIQGFTDPIQSQLTEIIEQLHIWLPENNRLTDPQMEMLARPILLTIGIELTFRPEVTYRCLEAVARLNKSKAITSYGLSKEKVDRVEYHYSNSGKTPADLWDDYIKGLPELGILIGYRRPPRVGIRVSPGTPINIPTSWRSQSLF